MIAQKVRYHAALQLVLVAGFAGAAHAQNALGNGRALEAPLQTPIAPGIVDARRTFANELAFREAVVSGTAPAGLSFQGDRLPSAFEFRGDLGEDSLFAYRRDSLYSGLAGKGIRGTDALQYQFALTTGARVPQSLAGQISYARAGAAERSPDPYTPYQRDLSSFDGGLQRDTTNTQQDPMLAPLEVGASLIQPVRSLSTYAANRGLQPTLVGLMQNRVTHQSAGQTASPLLGVQVVPVDDLRSPDLGVPGQQATPPAGTVPTTVVPSTTETNPSGFEGVGVPTDPSAQAKPAYEQLIDRFRALSPSAQPEAQPGVQPGARNIPDWAKDLISVQKALRGITAPEQPSQTQTPGQDEPNPYEGVLDNTPPELAKTGLEGVLRPATPTFDLDVLRRVREAGGLTDTLIPTNLPQIDRYSAYMKSGQDLLSAERYFDAEEHFISAMSSRPGDVNALVGRAHAQIGAGLFLSAGLNVRQLLVRHPEISGMRYGAALLPSASRMEQASTNFRANLDSPSSGADSGLLLAYLGFQRQRPADVRDGLAALERWGDQADKRLGEMLRVVWLAEGADDADHSPADDGN